MIRIFLLAALVGLVSAQDNTTNETSTTDNPAPSPTNPVPTTPPNTGAIYATGTFKLNKDGSFPTSCNNAVLTDTSFLNNVTSFCTQGLVNATQTGGGDVGSATVTCVPTVSCGTFTVKYNAVFGPGGAAASDAQQNALKTRLTGKSGDDMNGFFATGLTLEGFTGTITESSQPVSVTTGGAVTNILGSAFSCTVAQKAVGVNCGGDTIGAALTITGSQNKANCKKFPGGGDGLLINFWKKDVATSVLKSADCNTGFVNVPTATEYTTAPACIPASSLTGISNDVLVTCTADSPAPPGPDPSPTPTTSSAITAGLSVVVGMFAILFM